MRIYERHILIFFILISGVLFLGSCKLKGGLSTYKTDKSLDVKYVIQKVTDNQLFFETLYFKKMLVSLEEGGTTKSVRANMFVTRDSAIIISVIPLMGIEIFRICMNKKEIRIIDRLNKKVVISDYNSFNDKFYVETNYDVIESILCNLLFTYPVKEAGNLNNYVGSVHKDYYSVISANSRQIERLNKKTPDFFVHEFQILPEIFKVAHTNISNSGKKLSLVVDYTDFKSLGKTTFPNQILVRAVQNDKNYKVTFNFNDIDLNGNNALNFRIPESYEVVSY